MITKNQLIECLKQPLPGEKAQFIMAPLGRGKYDPISQTNYRKAAVLLPIYTINSHPHLILTLRSEYDGVHSAQVSFPGGKFDKYETDASEVALREMEEETGVNRNFIEILGSLSPLYIPVSNSMVQPVIGWIDQEVQFQPDPREVQRIMKIPLEVLFESEMLLANDFFRLNNRSVDVPYLKLDSERVWGATAMIISELLTMVGRPIKDINSSRLPLR